MILLGILSGYSDITLLKTFGLFISDMFIKIFKCISLPIIALSIIVTLSNYRADGIMRTRLAAGNVLYLRDHVSCCCN